MYKKKTEKKYPIQTQTTIINNSNTINSKNFIIKSDFL